MSTQIGPDTAGMQRIDVHIGALQPFCQFTREQNVCQLWLEVTSEWIVAIVQVDIVEMNVSNCAKEEWRFSD